MLINTEIDLFGDESYLPRTRFDRLLDNSHSQPGYQLYEKMTSGAYLGELTRLIAIEVISSGEEYDDRLFNGSVPSKLTNPWEFTTSMMGFIESMGDQGDLASLVHEIGEYLGCAHDPRIQDVRRFITICRLVSCRAATLAAASLAAIIEQQPDLLSNQGPIVIGVNGSTFEKYPHMKQRIHRELCKWFGEATGARIQIDVARDGGSVGGALIAMLYSTKHQHGNLRSWLCIPPWNLKQKYLKKVQKLVSKLSTWSTAKRSPAISSNEKTLS
ncbi:hexokinase [Lichtheimia corymbifera JMRC:FSU:9682]|nr:hexokinase [Lichtheimia corymbifera JMRC:FSU:9682]